MEEWGTSIVSVHRGALGRQVTEAVGISREGLKLLLNSKIEFDLNNLSELVVKSGDRVLMLSLIHI